jgi:predicted RNase H-like HicB family nuclease
MKYTVIVEKGRESGYVAHVPALRGCVSQGKTKTQALANVKVAMEAYIEALLEDGLPVPTEAGKEAVEVEVAAR